MAIKSVTTEFAGQASVYPRLVRLVTTDSFTTITAAGYLNNNVNVLGISFLPSDFVFCEYLAGQTGQTSTLFTLTFSAAGIITMHAAESSVVTPTIANHIATYTNTTGTLSEDPATAISGGNIQAGLSGTAGYLASFPTTASKGSLRLVGAASSGDTVTQITNASQAAARVFTIPDPGVSTTTFLLADNASTQTIATGNLAVTAGTIITTNGGVIQSGSSGHAGSLKVFPTTAAKGDLKITCSDQAGNTEVTVNAAAMGQATALSIPDPGVASSSFLLADNASTQTIATGNLAVTAGTIITTNGGVIQSGSSGHAGSIAVFPATAASGSLKLVAVNNGGAFNATISNGVLAAQSSVYTLPDPVAATANIAVAPAALVGGNLIQASGTAGLVADAGVAVAALQTKANIKAAQVTSGLTGSGAGPYTVTLASVTTASVIVANNISSSNGVHVLSVAPGTGNFAVTFTGDPGAACSISYVACIAAQ